MSKFNNLATVAKFRNKQFKAKGVRNDTVLYQTGKVQAGNVDKQVNRLLHACEASSTKHQQELQKARIADKIKKRQRQLDYTKKLLNDCKSWQGPATSTRELEVILADKIEELSDRIVRAELSYYKHTHRNGVLARAISSKWFFLKRTY